MSKLLKLFTTESVFIILLSLLSLTLGMLPTIYRYLVTPSDRVFVGTEFYSDDYSIYVSNILQGMKGRWTLLDKHTTEPHQGTIIHAEYLLWGKLTGLFGIHQIASYHLSRIFFGAIFLLVSYFLIFQTFPKDKRLRKLSFFLAIVSASFPIINNNPALNSKWHMSWFMEIEAVVRNTVLLHYLLGYILFILSGIFLMRSLTTKENSSKLLILAISLGALLAFIHPVNLIIQDTTLLIYLLFYLLSKILKNKNLSPKLLILYIIKPALFFFTFIIFTSPILIYYLTQFDIPPWNHMKQWENVTNFYPEFKEYILAIGPLSIFALIGMLISLKKAENYILFLYSWIASVFSLVYFSYPILRISQIRFMHNPMVLPFAIFGSLGINWLAKWSSRLYQYLRYASNRQATTQLLQDLFQKFLIFIFSFLIIFISLPTYYYSLIFKFKTFSDFSTLIFPDKKQAEAFDWLSKNTNPDDPVIAAYEASSTIPFWSGNTIYAGHLWATLNYPEKSKKVGVFFSGQLGNKEAKKFLEEGRISYVFYGFQEKSMGGNIEKYPFLKPVFQNPAATIFKFDKP